MNDADRQLLIEVRDLLRKALPILSGERDDQEHELTMMIGTAPDLQAAIKARNARLKLSGKLMRRADG